MPIAFDGTDRAVQPVVDVNSSTVRRFLRVVERRTDDQIRLSVAVQIARRHRMSEITSDLFTC